MGKVADTLHRLAESRKAIVSMMGVAGAALTEAAPYLVQWLQLFGLDQAKQTQFVTTCHLIAAGLLGASQYMAKLIKDEDVALKTPLDPPSTRPAEVQTNTVNVTQAAATLPPVKLV